jgi:hypothetical protein
MSRIKGTLVVIVLLFITILSGSTLLAQGTVLADTGFRPQQHGFSFANYGNESQPVNLTPASMQNIFGERVCKAVQNGECVLTATSQMWMDKANTDMGGGHCEGMAILSKLIYSGDVNLNDIDPNAQSIADLKADNPNVQAEIARWFATQYVPPSTSSQLNDQTPNEVVDTLVERMQEEKGPFTLAFFQADGKGGHAVTPYSAVDMGDGVTRVMVYDNNYPGQERFIEVDRNNNSWKYTGTTNPDEPVSEYSGTAESFSLNLRPSTERLVRPQECTFCKPGDGGIGDDGDASGSSGDACNQTAVSTGPNTDMVVTTADGHKAGVVNGRAFSDIEGATILRTVSETGLDGDTPGAIITLPSDSGGGNMSVTVNGEGGDDVMMMSCGQYQRVSGMSQEDGESDTLTFSPDASSVTGEVDPDESVTFEGGYNNPDGDDQTYALYDVTSEDGSIVHVGADPETGDFSYETSGDTSFDALFSAIDPNGDIYEAEFIEESTAGNEGLSINLSDAVYEPESNFEVTEADSSRFDDFTETRDANQATLEEAQIPTTEEENVNGSIGETSSTEEAVSTEEAISPDESGDAGETGSTGEAGGTDGSE